MKFIKKKIRENGDECYVFMCRANFAGGLPIGGKAC